jgi:hypothetical protein
MKKYENGKIYKIEPICEHEEGDIYIGSTAQKYLCNRMVKHKQDYKKFKNDRPVSRLTVFKIFEKYGIENCVITLIESVNCNSKEELLSKERFYIQTLKCVNKYVPLRTNLQWKKDNIERHNNYRKQYYQDNKESVDTYKNEWISNNKEKVKQYKNLYYQTNKAKYADKFVCECGVESLIYNKSRHFKTKKHQDFINGSK